MTTYQTLKTLMFRATIAAIWWWRKIPQKSDSKEDMHEFGTRISVDSRAFCTHSYAKPLWENIQMRANKSQWQSEQNCLWMDGVCKWGCRRANEQRMRGKGAKSVCVMCPLSMHQFIEISICALENKTNSNISMSSDPWNFCAPTGLPVHRRRNYRAN